ncbi:MAG TPA: TetR/AcrR family transcriptional regulator [Nakamurella sp.]|jgi:AcrR family transcriptional regulator|nr:TetR/AcrR family transcriptional regulator [Nakamurella sp.]
MGPSAPSPVRARRERERAQARTAILDAARELAQQEGWDAVSMRRLAGRIGYSTNYAYRYFSGRDDILLALVTDGFTRLAEAMRAAGPSLHAAAAAYLDFALAEPDLYQIMYGLGGVHVPAADTVTQGNAVGRVIADLLETEDPNDDRVVRIWATAHGLLALRSAGKLPADRTYLHRQLRTVITQLQPDQGQP